MILTPLEIASKSRGMVPPDDHAIFGPVASCTKHFYKAPSAVEAELASREHRDQEINDFMKRYLKVFGDEVTRMEIEALEKLGLPDIETVRRAYVGDMSNEVINEYPGQFDFGSERRRAYKKTLQDFQENILDDPDVKQDPEQYDFPVYEAVTALPIFLDMILRGYSLGLKKVWADILRNYPGDNGELDGLQVMPQLQNEYLKAIAREGGLRIKTRLGRYHLVRVREALIEMAQKGDNPLKAGLHLHRQVGEGNLWYWNRITRSESALARNVAFDVQGQAARVKYEKWMGSPNACEICQMFIGQVWKFREGPRPVTDTHPHCLCDMIAYYEAPGKVRPQWDRPSPYDEPYDPAEVNRLTEFFNQQ